MKEKLKEKKEWPFTNALPTSSPLEPDQEKDLVICLLLICLANLLKLNKDWLLIQISGLKEELPY